jgi:phage gp29-like protein
MEVFGLHIPFTKVANVTQNLPPKSNIQRTVKFEQTLHRTRQDIGTWRAAMLQAESLHYPNRQELYRLYKDVMLDAHLTGLIATRKYQILQSEYKVVDKAGNEVEDKTELLKHKWFYDFIDLSLDSIYYGFSLIQFGALENDVFRTIDLVPRQYVKQEFDIVVETPAAITGENFLDAKYKGWVIGVGQKRDLGLLAKAAPYVLWKKGAMQAWAEYTEIFGTPIRIGKTNVRDEVTRSNMENFLKNMGVSAYGVFDTDDLIELVESNRTDAFDVFDKMIDRCNSELSKLILGQTGTTDEKSYSGSANVHERVLKMYGEADEMLLDSIFTYQLVPLLNYHGLGFEGLRIESEEEDKFSYEEKAKIDLELLKYYDIDPIYIEKEYGTPVTKKAVDNTGSIQSVKNKLDEYYS